MRLTSVPPLAQQLLPSPIPVGSDLAAASAGDGTGGFNPPTFSRMAARSDPIGVRVVSSKWGGGHGWGKLLGSEAVWAVGEEADRIPLFPPPQQQNDQDLTSPRHSAGATGLGLKPHPGAPMCPDPIWGLWPWVPENIANEKWKNWRRAAFLF